MTDSDAIQIAISKMPAIQFQLERRAELLKRLGEITLEIQSLEAEAKDIEAELYG